MSFSIRDFRLPPRYHLWKWWVCGLLLLATMMNYMDRLTLNQLGPVMRGDGELHFDIAHYGYVESGFAVAFALGAIVCGFAVDWFGVYWLYPLAVLGWSVAGFCTGYSWDFWSLFLCRVLLGLAESGNWPCALRTTQGLLPPEERSMGNGILQSGAALGAMLTPGIVHFLVSEQNPWRIPFFAIGAVGMTWVALWFATIRSRSMARIHLPASEGTPLALANGLPQAPPLPRLLFLKRMAALIILVVTINASWHFFRAWLPLFLNEEMHYTRDQSDVFFTLYYIAAGLGSVAAGGASWLIVRWGMSVHWGRVLVFLGFAVLTALSVAAAFVESGLWLPGLLLAVGFGALGVFPNYYSFSQELTTRHQGKLTGCLGFSCWMSMAALHALVGNWVEYYHSYRQGVAVAGLLPLVGLAAFLLLWGKTPQRVVEPERDEAACGLALSAER